VSAGDRTASDTAWVRDAIAAIAADFNRSADTHLIRLQLPCLAGIDLYLKDESTHPTGSLKHRLARSLFLYGLCNGWIGPRTAIVESSSGSTAISEAYFARLLGLRFIAVVPASTAPEKIAAIEFYGGECRRVAPGAIYAQARDLACALDGHYMDQFTYAERATDWRGNNNIAESIFAQMGRERHPVPRWVVVSAGTGGTSSTIGRYIRYHGELAGTTQLAVVDPEHSVFADYFDTGDATLTSGRPSRIEGIGRQRVEPSFLRTVVDAVAVVDVLLHHRLEVVREGGATQGRGLLAVDEDRRRRRLAGAGQRDADVGVLGFAGAVHDAAHDGDIEGLDAGIGLLPFRHGGRDPALDVARELLEHRRGGAAAARAGGDERHEGAKAHRLQQLLGDLHLHRAVAARLGGERDADRVADALLQQDAHGGGRGDDALRPHAGLGEAEVDGVVRALRQHAVDGDQILHRRDLGGQDDAIARQADLLGAHGRQQRRLHHRLARDGAGVDRRGAAGVLVHEVGQQLLVERAPVRADAHGLAVADRHLDDGELPVPLVLEADIAGIDAVLGQRLGAGRMIGEQLVADVVEVADEGHVDAAPGQPVADVRNRRGRLVAVHRDAHQL
jgi:cysteine synthase